MLLLTGCTTKNDTWYTRISNEYVKEHNTDGNPIDLSGAGHMPYAYTIPCWNADGDCEELTFGADQEIEDGTYLSIHTEMLRGVTEYNKIKANEIPPAVLKDIHDGLNIED